MNLTGNAVFITGGGSGIGLALAAALLELGNEVMICGRDPEKLERARAAHPGLRAVRCDLARARDLEGAAETVRGELGRLSLLVNNAGVQFNYVFAEDGDALERIDEEIASNFTGHVKLTRLLLPLLLAETEAAVVNVSSVLALAPKQSAPVYCATKAALRSFTKALRYQLEGSPVKVFEVMPPLVDTAMTTGRGEGRGRRKIAPEQIARAVVAGLGAERYEIRPGLSQVAFAIHRLMPGLLARMVRAA